MDQYADDLAEPVDKLDLRRAFLVGHSTGAGEVTRYIGRHATARVAKAVRVGAVPPIMRKTAAYPGSLPLEVFDGIRKGVAADRSQDDLSKFDVPTLIVHGDDDRIVPIGNSAHLSSKLVRGSTLKLYPGGDRGLAQTHQDRLNADLLAFAST